MSRKKTYAVRIPLPVRGGIRAQSRRGGCARQWWGRRWLEMIEGLQIGARLGRGRSYALSGQVSSLVTEPGRIVARVQGSDHEAYSCAIGLALPPEETRRELAAALRARPLLVARLLVRELPREVEALFRAAGQALFPAGREDLEMRCSCRDWANPCKHLVAVQLLLIEALDQDPLLLLALRGIGRDALLGQGEREAPAAARLPAGPPGRQPPDAAAVARAAGAGFWGAPSDMDPDFGPAPAEAAAAAPLARRLGPLPFWRGEERFLDTIGQASARAVAAGWRAWAGERVPAPRVRSATPLAPQRRRGGRPRMEM